MKKTLTIIIIILFTGACENEEIPDAQSVISDFSFEYPQCHLGSGQHYQDCKYHHEIKRIPYAASDFVTPKIIT